MDDKADNRDYSKRELDHYFGDIRNDLKEIKLQTQKTNGRVSKHDKILLIVATAIGVLLVTNSSELLQLFKIII